MSDGQQQPTQEPGTAVAPRRKLSPERQAQIDEARERNAITQAIRGTQWSKDANEQTIRAVSQYCWQHNLDPMRHVELLGGRIYLTVTLYDEKAAPYVRAGLFVVAPPDLIQADDRLDTLADLGDEWAIEERKRRMRLRIKHGVPEKAEGARIQEIRIAGSDTVAVGVNWCGKGLRMKKRRDGSIYDDDPVVGNEPTKTAITRARRRAWIQLIEGSLVQMVAARAPELVAEMGKIEGSRASTDARLDEIHEEMAQVVEPIGRKALPVPGPDEYGGNANPSTQVPVSVHGAPTEAQRARARAALEEESPYGEFPPPVGVSEREAMREASDDHLDEEDPQ